MISTAELAVRLFVYLLVVVAVPLSFVLMFRALDYIALDGLVEEYRNGRGTAERDRGQLNAYFEANETASVDCPHCGAANGENYTYCHTCQAKLDG